MERSSGVVGRVARKGSLFLTATIAAAMSAPSLQAQSDVTAFVDGAGDLWIVGDGKNASIRLRSTDNEDEFTVTTWPGFGPTTTVNGLALVTLFAPGRRFVLVLNGGNTTAGIGVDYGSDNSCCSRDLAVIGGSGNEILYVLGPGFRVNADLGAGNDQVLISEGASGIQSSFLNMGEGNDVIDLDSFVGVTDSTFQMGPGNDLFDLGWSGWVENTLVEMSPRTGTTLPDDDQVVGRGGGPFELRTGVGNDTVDIFDGWPSKIETGPGSDFVRLSGDLNGSDSDGLPLEILLQHGDDRLEVSFLDVPTARFDGGPGTDTYRDLGDNVFGTPPEVISFELPYPKATRGVIR